MPGTFAGNQGWLCAIAFTLLAILCGCSGSSTKGSVSGAVTFDGQPVRTGTIRFVPKDGQTATADSLIIDGQYTAQVPPGEKTVEISAPKVIGKRRMMPESPEIDIVEELLPAKFNVKSELSYKVATGSQIKDFTLTAK